MPTHDFLPFLLEMKQTAKEARSRGRRCHYTDDRRARALEFACWVLNQGGTVEDAAELLSMHRATLMNWLDRATTPGTDWEVGDPPPRVVVNVYR